MKWWILMIALGATACSTTVKTSKTWGIAVTEEMKEMLDGAKLLSGLYSTGNDLTLIRGKGAQPALQQLLDAYQVSSDVKFTEYPRSTSYNETDWPAEEIVTLRMRRHAYLEVVVESREQTRMLRLIRPGPGERHAQVVVLREFVRDHEYWRHVDSGLVANTPEIARSWGALDSTLRSRAVAVELPLWANRAPGSASLPFIISIPPHNLHPELGRG